MLDSLGAALDSLGYRLTGGVAALAGQGRALSSVGLLSITLVLLVGASLVMVLLAIALHELRMRLNRRRQAFNQAWQPVLFARMMGDLVALPKLAARDRMKFFLLWHRLHGHVSAEAADGLNRCVAELGLAEFARKLLHRHADWKRLLGLLCAVHLQDPASAPRLLALAMRGNPPFADPASRALLGINAPLGRRVLHHLLLNTDWFAPAMAELVRAGGPPALAQLEQSMGVAQPKRARRMVRVIEALDDFSALPILRARLAAAQEPVEIAGIVHAFGRLGSSEDRHAILQQAAAQSWLVRMECARALGRIGLPQDVAVLLQLSRDSVWWVRYRAAQSLVALIGTGAATALANAEPDGFARDMMRHVLAESVP